MHCVVLYMIVCWFDQALGTFPGIILLEGLGTRLVFCVLVKFVIVKRERGFSEHSLKGADSAVTAEYVSII